MHVEEDEKRKAELSVLDDGNSRRVLDLWDIHWYRSSSLTSNGVPVCDTGFATIVTLVMYEMPSLSE